ALIHRKIKGLGSILAPAFHLRKRCVIASERGSNSARRWPDTRTAVPTGAPSDQNGPLRFGCPRQHRRSLDRNFCSSRKNLYTANIGDVLRSNTVRVWVCAIRDGPLLLSERPKGLPRYKLLSGP